MYDFKNVNIEKILFSYFYMYVINFWYYYFHLPTMKQEAYFLNAMIDL